MNEAFLSGASGSFGGQIQSATNTGAASSTNTMCGLAFYADRSSSIYKNGTAVQMPALQVLPCIRT